MNVEVELDLAGDFTSLAFDDEATGLVEGGSTAVLLLTLLTEAWFAPAGI